LDLFSLVSTYILVGARGCCWAWTMNQRVKAGQEEAKTGPVERQRRLLKSNFSGFLRFPTNRTLTGWAVLFAMGKHTSKQFLYDREHVRVWKCRKTGTKVRPKTGLKRGPSQHLKSRKHRYTGKSSLQRGQKSTQKRVQKRPQNDGQKYVQNRIRDDELHIAF
jgi:hypothetical protein